jgi:NADPH-dependent 2,4-dienoyl-CoA reductase/sulfur reductase-like enzyme
MSALRRLNAERVLIVGSGRAGVAAAEELRRFGFHGELVVLGDEAEAPYYRPSCSKGLLTGSQRPSDVSLPLTGCVDVRWRFGRRAALLDPVARTVETTNNETYRYDGLIIASGSRASAPPNLPVGKPGLHVLHQLSDAWLVRQDLRDANTVAIVGAGLTGCEVASAVWSMARECIVIDSNKQVMTRALGGPVGKLLTQELRRAGVKLLLGRQVEEVSRRRSGQWRLFLSDHTYVDADVVVLTTGERPETSWLEDVPGIDASDGILCDESLRVVGADDIVAAGAVARWPNLRNGTAARRSGQWITALVQGRAAAQTLLAGDEPVRPVTPLNRLFSEQFGLRIQCSGDVEDRETQVHLTRMRPRRRDVARAGVLVSYVKDDRVVGLVAVNAPRAFIAVTRMLLLSPRPAPMTRSGRLDLGAVEGAGIETREHRPRTTFPTHMPRPDRRPAHRAPASLEPEFPERESSPARTPPAHTSPARAEPPRSEPAPARSAAPPAKPAPARSAPVEREDPRREDPRREDPRREDPRREDPRREDPRRERAEPAHREPAHRALDDDREPDFDEPEFDEPGPHQEPFPESVHVRTTHRDRSDRTDRTRRDDRGAGRSDEERWEEPFPESVRARPDRTRDDRTRDDRVREVRSSEEGRTASRRHRDDPAYADSDGEADIIWRTSGVHPARSPRPRPRRQPDEWLEDDQPAGEPQRPTISSRRPEDEENWVYS